LTLDRKTRRLQGQAQSYGLEPTRNSLA